MKLRCFLVALALGLFPLAAQDRLPPIPADKQTAEQKKALELLSATPRGPNSGTGPFGVLLRSPELLNRLQSVGEYLRFNNSLPQKMVEMTILMTSRELTQQYEWDSHYPLALRAGLKTDVATAIAFGRRPDNMAEEEEIAYNFVSELFQHKSVSDPTYARFLAKFGERGVVDTVALVGYYTTLALELNTARVPGQTDSTAPKLTPFPR